MKAQKIFTSKFYTTKNNLFRGENKFFFEIKFRYHMQMGGSSQMQGNKSPPAPMVQTSVSGHSRNVSQSSGTSNQDAS